MNFTVYSKRLCPYCDKVKQVLNHLSLQKGYTVIVYELDSDFNRQEFYEKFGEGSTFPRVILNDTLLGGCSDTVKYLHENNLL